MATKRALAWAFLGLLLADSAVATTITHNATNLSGNTWQYAYTVTNDTLSYGIEEFTIFYDDLLYQNLSLVSAPLDWDALVIEPSITLPDAGFLDGLALSAAIAPGESVGEFVIQFDYLASGNPGGQYYEIVDPFTWDVLDSGDTVVASAVPLPAGAWLFLSGIAMLTGVTVRKRAHSAN